MKKLLIGLLTLAQLASPLASAAQASSVSPADLQALQQKGRGLANAAQSQTPVFGADGKLVRDASSGAAQMAPSSQQSIVAQSTYVQNLTGIQGYQGTANPGQGTSAGAQVSASQYADFSCATQRGQRKALGAQVVQVDSCNGPITGLQSLSVRLCSALAQGGICDPTAHPESFSAVTVPVGDWAPVANGNIGASCNASGVCRITLRSTVAAGGEGNTLRAKAQAQVAANGSNSLSPTVQHIVESKTDAQKQVALNARDCYLQNQDRMERGLPALTCDGTQLAGISGVAPAGNTSSSAAPANCNSDQRVCLRESTQTVTYTRSCTRTFPLTEYSVPWKVPTKECLLTKPAQDASAPAADGAPTSSCSAADLAGAIKVGSTQGQCDSQGNCNTQSWTDYYVFPEKAAPSGAGTVYPSPMQGSPELSCANKGKGALGGCADGGWFGRTVDDSQCYRSTSTTLADGSVAQSTTALTNDEHPGCGYCAAPIYTDTCYAQATANEPADSCGAIPEGCTLTGSTPQSSISGITTSQVESYSCTKQETSCAQYQTQPGCTTDLAQGMDHAPVSLANTAAFNQAMASTAVMTAIQKSAQDSGNPTMPRIFTGTDLRCRKPTGYLSGLLLNDCCKISLERPGGSRPMHKCTDNEVKLAASRRANQTVYIGDYCSKEVGFWKAKKCVERTETYCSFDGVLSRLIQAQGRAQLATMVSSGFGSSESQQMVFPYYKDQGGWGTPVNVNGVSVVAWQYPAYCASAKQTADALAANPGAIACPNALTQWFATCDKASCGDLPFAPELGSDSWLVQQVDPLKNHLESISHTATVDGACDPSTTQCHYTVTAWPAATGGKATITNDWAFNLYQTDPNGANPLFSLGDNLLRPHQLPGVSDSKSMPDALTMDFSPDYGVTWVPVLLPTRTTGNGVAMPNSDVVIAGSCDPAANTCTYKGTGTVVATLKPWGNEHNPDCSGYTPGQISLLDFGKMDLSEWIAQVMGKIQPPDAGTLGQLASQQARDFYDAMAQGGKQTSTSPMRSQFAHVSPQEAMGPFNAKLYVSAYWPIKKDDDALNTDPVLSVQVDWGDCSLSMMADHITETVNGKLAEAFVAAHTYPAPDKLACNAAEASVVHKVHLTITAKSGVHYTDLQVTNQWHDLTGQTVGLGESSGGSIDDELSAPLPGKTP